MEKMEIAHLYLRRSSCKDIISGAQWKSVTSDRMFTLKKLWTTIQKHIRSTKIIIPLNLYNIPLLNSIIWVFYCEIKRGRI